MARTAKNTTEPREPYIDGQGVSFYAVRGLWLPEDVHEWQAMRPIDTDVHNLSVCLLMHSLFANGFNGEGTCWRCGRTRRLEAHHIFSRSDVMTNIAMLCAGTYQDSCHVRVQHNTALLPEVLRLKWTHDREHTSWVTLARLYGKHLPDLEG